MAARPICPEPWPPRKPRNCCLWAVQWHPMCAQTALAAYHPLQLKNRKIFNFFYILIMHNDQIFCVKRVLGPLYVFFTLVRCLEG